MEKYKRWINSKVPGQTSYITSTCLDFAHLLARDEMKTKMTLSILRDCQYYNASLHGFVVMAHHIHLLVTPKSDETMSSLMRNVKRRSAKILIPHLNEFEKKQISMQKGLNRHSFWKEGFRGLPIVTTPIFSQKLHYIHSNPLRANIEQSPEKYFWSSFKQYHIGNVSDEFVLDLPKCIQFYELNSQ